MNCVRSAVMVNPGLPGWKQKNAKLPAYHLSKLVITVCLVITWKLLKRIRTKIPEHYIRKQTLVNSERYISPQLKEYEAKVLGAEERIKNLEYELYNTIRKHLHDQIPLLQQFVDVVAQLDVFTCFGWLAYYNDYVQPEFSDNGIMQITECRHPVIEKLLTDEQYIPNDVELNSTDNRITLLTDPIWQVNLPT